MEFCFPIATEYGIYHEGDMILTDEQLDDLYFPVRNGLINQKYRWPNGIVPYVMSTDYSNEQKEHIKQALQMIESVSCIKFVRRNNEPGYIQIKVSVH